MAVCHADVKHPTRGQGLTLRNVRKIRSQRPANVYGETPPALGAQASPIQLIYTLNPKLQARLNPPSNSSLSGSQKKLRNFFGQRPLSELITSCLTEFFPATSRKIPRNSMLRVRSKQNSDISMPPELPFSTSPGGSHGHRKPSLPPQSSMGSAPPIQDNASMMAIKEEVAPLSMSVPTDHGGMTGDIEWTNKLLDHTLPPTSLSDSLGTGLSATEVSRSKSNAYKRMGMVFAGRDKSDIAGLLDMAVECRHQSIYSAYGGDEMEVL